eukprot:12324595-Alexandrium_andersonii.AAC.1
MSRTTQDTHVCSRICSAGIESSRIVNVDASMGAFPSHSLGADCSMRQQCLGLVVSCAPALVASCGVLGCSLLLAWRRWGTTAVGQEPRAELPPERPDRIPSEQP